MIKIFFKINKTKATHIRAKITIIAQENNYLKYQSQIISLFPSSPLKYFPDSSILSIPLNLAYFSIYFKKT